MNITVPASMVTNDQVYKMRKKGCSNMSRPSVITTHAAISIWPRRNRLGQWLYAGAALADVWCEDWGVDMAFELWLSKLGLLAHSAKGNTAQQMLAQQHGENQNWD
jgi:hypothetical protein